MAPLASVEHFGLGRPSSTSLTKSPKHPRRTTIQAERISVRLTKRKDGTIPRLGAEDLEKGFSTGAGVRLEVIRGLSLTIEVGAVVAITGDSGTGKSTLLHLLGALDPVCKRPLFGDS